MALISLREKIKYEATQQNRDRIYDHKLGFTCITQEVAYVQENKKSRFFHVFIGES